LLPVTVPRRRRDPAPSRIRYRLHRLWLRPGFRWLVKRGVPLAVAVGLIWSVVSDPAVIAAVEARVAAVRAAIAARPEFALDRIEVEGAEAGLADAVRKAAGVSLPGSAFGLDVAAVRERVAAVDAVQSAEVRVTGGGVLRIRVVPRQPAALWRDGAKLTVIDRDGRRVGLADARASDPDLPLLSGEGAAGAVPEALAILAAAAPVAARVRGLVRVGNRRWDLVLDRDQRILLPETGAEAAIARVMALHAAEDILGRDLVQVDMRDGRRPVLRLSAPALDELRRLKVLVAGDRT
jgi:cell division protein FtsQ